MKKAFAIIPAYNEEQHIAAVISGVRKYLKDIVVVDDGSSDQTYEAAGKTGAAALKHVINLGKGAALKTGCDYAVEHGAEWLVLIDADTQHDPAEIPNFLKKLEEGNEVIFGYRIINSSMPAVLRFGNRFITSCTRFLYGMRLHDTTCGFRALTAEAYKKIRWEAAGYFVEAEMIANVGKEKLSFAEVPIQTIYSDKYKGTTVMDGVKIVGNMVLWRLRR